MHIYVYIYIYTYIYSCARACARIKIGFKTSLSIEHIQLHDVHECMLFWFCIWIKLLAGSPLFCFILSCNQQPVLLFTDTENLIEPIAHLLCRNIFLTLRINILDVIVWLKHLHFRIDCSAFVLGALTCGAGQCCSKSTFRV